MGIKVAVQDFASIGTISLNSLQMAGNVHFIDPSSNSCQSFNKVIVPNPIEFGDICECSFSDTEGIWYQKGEETSRAYQEDVFIFKLASNSQYVSLFPQSIVDSTSYFSAVNLKYNTIFFTSYSTKTQRDSIKDQIRQLSDFEFEFPAITKNQADWTLNQWFSTDNAINIAFHSPQPSNEIVQYIADKFNLSLQHQPSPNLPVGSNSWTYVFTLNSTSCKCRNAVNVARQIYEQDSSIVKIASPAITPSADVLATNDPYYGTAWHIENIGQCITFSNGQSRTASPGAGIDARAAWNEGYTGQGVTVAVIDRCLYDKGSRYHPDISDQYVGGYDFMDDDDDLTSSTRPDTGQPEKRSHGQGCAGLIAAIANNNEGTVGVAYDSKIIPIITLPRSPVRAFQYACENGADVINCSWGWLNEFDEAIANEIALCHNEGRDGKGIIIACAAKNDDRMLGSDEFVFPAGLPDVIGVMATDATDRRRSPGFGIGSNWNSPALDLAAPGDALISTDLVGQPGENFSVITNCPGEPDVTLDYLYFQETSAATPLVSAAAAVILSANPCLTADEVQDILQSSADKVGPYNYNPDTGKSPQLGHGRINLGAAISITPTSVEDQFSSSSFQIYPNPARDNFVVQTTILESQEMTLSVINSVGRVIKTETIAKGLSQGDIMRYEVDVEGLSDGLYFVTLKSGPHSHSKPLIINK